MELVTAVFDDRRFAEQAVDWLRSRGVPNDNISVLVRDARTAPATRSDVAGVHTDPGSDLARGAGTGLAAGAGVGALFGLAAAMIPGLGPLISAGALAAYLGATGGAAAAGAIVGGATGAVAGALSKWGLDQADAHYYADAIERGSVFVAAELGGTPLTRAQVEEAFHVFDGRFSRTAAPAAKTA
jgi:hypothetical protein